MQTESQTPLLSNAQPEDTAGPTNAQRFGQIKYLGKWLPDIDPSADTRWPTRLTDRDVKLLLILGLSISILALNLGITVWAAVKHGIKDNISHVIGAGSGADCAMVKYGNRWLHFGINVSSTLLEYIRKNAHSLPKPNNKECIATYARRLAGPSCVLLVSANVTMEGQLSFDQSNKRSSLLSNASTISEAIYWRMNSDWMCNKWNVPKRVSCTPKTMRPPYGDTWTLVRFRFDSNLKDVWTTVKSTTVSYEMTCET